MKMEVKEFESIKYAVRYPDGFETGKTYPVIILLHGAGGRGEDIEIVKTNPFFEITNKYEGFPFITVAPQCSANTWFDLFETLKKLVRMISKESFTDKERMYLIGASMGGYATWQLAMSMPEFFAAIAPVCGGGMYWNGGRLINVPVWAFHGAKDPVVLCRESEKMIEAVRGAGGEARLTIYPEVLHDAWTPAYETPELFEWFLAHTNKNTEQMRDDFKDSRIYG